MGFRWQIGNCCGCADDPCVVFDEPCVIAENLSWAELGELLDFLAEVYPECRFGVFSFLPNSGDIDYSLSFNDYDSLETALIRFSTIVAKEGSLPYFYRWRWQNYTTIYTTGSFLKSKFYDNIGLLENSANLKSYVFSGLTRDDEIQYAVEATERIKFILEKVTSNAELASPTWTVTANATRGYDASFSYGEPTPRPTFENAAENYFEGSLIQKATSKNYPDIRFNFDEVSKNFEGNKSFNFELGHGAITPTWLKVFESDGTLISQRLISYSFVMFGVSESNSNAVSVELTSYVIDGEIEVKNTISLSDNLVSESTVNGVTTSTEIGRYLRAVFPYGAEAAIRYDQKNYEIKFVPPLRSTFTTAAKSFFGQLSGVMLSDFVFILSAQEALLEDNERYVEIGGFVKDNLSSLLCLKKSWSSSGIYYFDSYMPMKVYANDAGLTLFDEQDVANFVNNATLNYTLQLDLIRTYIDNRRFYTNDETPYLWADKTDLIT